MRNNNGTVLHCSRGARGTFWSYRSGVFIPRRVERMPTVFTRMLDATNLGFIAFTKWGIATAQDPKWLDPLTGAIQDLSQRAAACGIDSLNGSHKEVRDSAEECGIGEYFQAQLPNAVQVRSLNRDADSGPFR